MNNFKYVPLGDNIVVRPDAKEKESAGGIILPDTEGGEAVTKGEVVAVPDIDFPLQAGDRIQYNQFGGVKYDIDGETLLVMTIHDVVLRERRGE